MYIKHNKLYILYFWYFKLLLRRDGFKQKDGKTHSLLWENLYNYNGQNSVNFSQQGGWAWRCLSVDRKM
jgi:hypothetical protein